MEPTTRNPMHGSYLSSTIRANHVDITRCRVPALELSAEDWREYLRRLYGEGSDERMAEQLDVLNLTMLSNISAVAHRYATTAALALPRDAPWGTCSGCINKSTFVANLNVHCPIELAWRLRMHKRSTQVLNHGGFAPIANGTWAEATHCGGSAFEPRAGAFFYAARGSNLWINIGRTLAFGMHEDAVRHFLGRDCNERGLDPQTGMRQCNGDLDEMARAAHHRGYDTVQFLRRAFALALDPLKDAYFVADRELMSRASLGVFVCVRAHRLRCKVQAVPSRDRRP